MSYDLTGLLPFLVVVALLALAGGIASAAVISQSLVSHHRARLARHESVRSHYRRLVLAR